MFLIITIKLSEVIANNVDFEEDIFSLLLIYLPETEWFRRPFDEEYKLYESLNICMIRTSKDPPNLLR